MRISNTAATTKPRTGVPEGKQRSLHQSPEPQQCVTNYLHSEGRMRFCSQKSGLQIHRNANQDPNADLFEAAKAEEGQDPHQECRKVVVALLPQLWFQGSQV